MEKAKKYLESKGCNLESHIIDYDFIASCLVGYHKQELKKLVDDDSPKYSKHEVINALHKAELQHNKNYTKIWDIMSQHLNET